MRKMKKINSLLILLLIFTISLTACGTQPPTDDISKDVDTDVEVSANKLSELPSAQEIEGDYSFENSGINNKNLTEYLNREDTIYIDLRDYEDYSKKHLKNFEVIPFFAFIHDDNAGDEGYPQLFRGSHEEPEAVYESSVSILKELFPQDKNLMIVCQSGGRVAMLMKMLEANGYDMSKVYNIGGLAQYTGGEYRDLITDTEEFNVEVDYMINAQ